MKKFYILCLCALACLIPAVLIYAPSTDKAAEQQATSSFTAIFPSEPFIETRDLPIPGQDSTLPYTEYKQGNYSVSFTTLPASWTKWSSTLVLSGALKVVLTDTMTLSHKHSTSCHDFPALSYEASGPEGMVLGKLVLVGSDLYKVEVLFQQDAEKEAATNFIDSFNPVTIS